MVLDTSALLAILLQEREAKQLACAIEADPMRLMSAATFLETAIVAEARAGDIGGRELDLFMYHLGPTVVPVDREQAEVARQAYRAYGKGRHPAALNYGDCFSYALSKTAGEPLLFKGNDFGRTDISVCEHSSDLS